MACSKNWIYSVAGQKPNISKSGTKCPNGTKCPILPLGVKVLWAKVKPYFDVYFFW